MKRNHKKGFTLIELVVVITIIGLIGTSVTGLLVFGLDIFGLANQIGRASCRARVYI